MSMPTGALGEWYAVDAISSPRLYIPNAAASENTPKALWHGSRRVFATHNTFPHNNVTVTDNAVNDNDGNQYAATAVFNATDSRLGRRVSLSAGTYTAAIWVKRNTGSDQSFTTVPGNTARTATDTWQRISWTFAHAGGNADIYLNAAGSTPNLQVTDFDLFAGSSDLGSEGPQSGMTIRSGSVSGNWINLTSTSNNGWILLPQPTTLTDVTVVTIAKKTAASSGYVAALCKARGLYANFGAFLEFASVSGFAFGSGASWANHVSQNAATLWKWLNLGTHVFAHRYNDTTQLRSLWVDGGEYGRQSVNLSTQSVFDMYVGMIDTGFGGGWQIAAIAMWDRALTDQEIRDAQEAMLTRSGVNERDPLNLLVQEGDSITNGSTNEHAYLFTNTHQNPVNIGAAFAVSGSTLTNAVSRRPSAEMMPPPASMRVPGDRFIYTMMMTNGVSNYPGASDAIAMADYATALAAHVDSLKAAGWKVVLGTVVPRSSPANDPHNARRNILNPVIRSWVGGRLAAVYDFAADSTIGTDAAGSDTGLYPDGIHPTSTVQSTYLLPLYRDTVNAVSALGGAGAGILNGPKLNRISLVG